MYLKEEKQSAKENYAIIVETTSGEEKIDMAFFRVNWKNYVDALAKTASQEDWSNPRPHRKRIGLTQHIQIMES